MNDQISALLDDELDEGQADRLVRRLKTDPELRRAWDEYHRVGDALRGHLAPDITAAVAARLAAEPTIMVPRRQIAKGPQAFRWLLPVAASLAAVALVAWMALPVRAPGEQLAAASSAAPQVAVPLASGAQIGSARGRAASSKESRNGAPSEALAQAPLVSGQRAQRQAEALSALGMGDYLLAHQRFSPSSALQGVAPYVRIVSHGDDQ
jgi:sigma-E factor negative regulatory protein RseA